ncbi:MAG TPA: HAD-IA family hydrolase [Tepidisphaeraceae bacterium]|jgi:putative hydrolase of the HAD superfamily
MPNIHLVCFDLGRVLIRICNDWKHACQVAGVAAPSEITDPARLSQLNTASCQFDVGAISTHQFTETVAPLMGLSPSDVLKLVHAYLRGPYEGAEKLIDDVRATGVKTACLSNTNETHWAMMSDEKNPNVLPLHKLDYHFASHLVKARKPEPKLYEHVERASGLESAQIVFFDDVPDYVAAAKDRGWHATRSPSTTTRLRRRGRI